jgi:hypothetical protein
MRKRKMPRKILYLAMLENVYGCEFTYVHESEKAATRELIKSIIDTRSEWGDKPFEEYSGITFGSYNFSELKNPGVDILDEIAEYYGVNCYKIKVGRFECDRQAYGPDGVRIDD